MHVRQQGALVAGCYEHLQGTLTEGSRIVSCGSRGDKPTALALRSWSFQQTELRDAKRSRLYGVAFDFGAHQIRPDSRATLDQVAGVLKANGGWRITIEGHTDNVGGEQANQLGCVDHQEGIADDETHAFFTRLMDEGGAMLWVHPTIAGHGPTLYQSWLPRPRRLERVSAKPLRSGVVAIHYRRALTQSRPIAPSSRATASSGAFSPRNTAGALNYGRYASLHVCSRRDSCFARVGEAHRAMGELPHAGSATARRWQGQHGGARAPVGRWQAGPVRPVDDRGAQSGCRPRDPASRQRARRGW